MSDQAQDLRNLVQSRQLQNERTTRIITVTSGKGGVGKSNFTLNFALTLQSRGYKVLIFDADMGLANIDVLMGISPKYNLYHLLNKEKSIGEIIYTHELGLQFIAGGSGFMDLLSLSEEQLQYFISQVNELSGEVDYIIFDTGAGLSKETLQFIISSNETIVVTTPEPTAITDAYAIIKMVHFKGYPVRFKLVVNRVSDLSEGKQTSEKLSMVAQKFLDLEIKTLGYVSDDSHVMKSVKKQIPFSLAYPHCEASKSLQLLTNRFLRGIDETDVKSGGLRQFVTRLLGFHRS